MNRAMLRTAALVAFCFASPALAEAAPYEAVDLFKISQIDSPQVSPDGKHVLFTRS